MPGGNRTGPQESGPKTGRAAGYCSGYESPGYANVIRQDYMPRRYYYRGLGRGYGRRKRRLEGRKYHQIFPYNNLPYCRDENTSVNKKNEKNYLEDMIKQLEEEIKIARNRIQEILKVKKD